MIQAIETSLGKMRRTFKLPANSTATDLEEVIQQIKGLERRAWVLVKRGTITLNKGKQLRRDAAVAFFEQMVRVIRAVAEDERAKNEDQDDEVAVVFPRIHPGGSRQRNETRRMLSTCWTCNARRHEKETDFKCCSRCNCACYCSEACQRADWEGGHNKVCKKLDRLNSLDKGAKIQVLSLQLSIKAIPEPQPTVHLIMYTAGLNKVSEVNAHKNSDQAGTFQFMCLSPPGYEESIRRSFPMLPHGEPIFKFGGDMCNKIVFVTLSGKVIIYKDWNE